MPRTLKPILRLREQLKARARAVGPAAAAIYKERQNALKWMLVTCFGYLGYKNARFGRIEAHEAVTAHAVTSCSPPRRSARPQAILCSTASSDCLWLHKLESDSCRGGLAWSALGRAHTGVRPYIRG